MKLKPTILLLTVVLFNKGLTAQSSTDINNYINRYRDIAISEMQRTGIPASITLAQGIHETEAGTSELVKKSNNHFGIKCKDNWTGSVVYHDDDERGECFRSYDNPADSYKDHSDFLRNSSRYSALFRLDPLDYRGWAYGLKKAGYATNPRYPQILIQLIEDYNLQQYTLIAMGKIKPPDDMIAGNKNELPFPGTAITPKNTVQYPDGQFSINNSNVIFAKAGTSLLALSDQYSIPLARLIDFNDLKEEDVLVRDQLIYLQRKRKTGAADFHIVQPGETMYDICQAEGIRYESLLSMNLLSPGEEPAAGEKIYLKSVAASKPALQNEKYNTAMAYTPDTRNGDTATTANPAAPMITHVVQPKETLYSISKKYGVAVDQIQKWNKLDSLSLRTGQELIIYKN